MINFMKDIKKFKRIQQLNTFQRVIIVLTSGKDDEKYNEQMRKNWKYRFLNILL